MDHPFLPEMMGIGEPPLGLTVRNEEGSPLFSLLGEICHHVSTGDIYEAGMDSSGKPL